MGKLFDKRVPQKKGNNLHIIAIGSSAGGLSALKEFFSGFTKAPPNCCFIIAQHLSPGSKSHLDELLGRETTIPLKWAADQEKLIPGTIFIAPPKNNLTVENGKIQLRISNTIHKPCIDVLFKSVAEEYRNKVIGIILSGTGTDGIAGMAAVKQNGGLTIVQEPKTAEYDGMPLAVMAANKNDYNLRPSQMSGIILQYAAKGKLPQHSEKNKQELPQQFEAIILEKVEAYSGTNFANYKTATILRRMARRMQQLQLKSSKAYYAYIEKNPGELAELYRSFIITVTSFFRDKEAFTLLRKKLEALIKKKNPGEDIRVWVAGCATGEEAYTIAILFHEILEEKIGNYRIQIFASDIDEAALRLGRKGLYSAEAIEGLSPKILGKYFLRNGKNFELVKSCRSLVLFSKHDLTSNPSFVKMDLISCRNLLIYFNSVLQDKILATFNYALNENGLLFLGKSETVGKRKDAFTPVNAKHKLYSKNASFTKKIPAGLVKSIKLISQISNTTAKGASMQEILCNSFFESYEHPYVVVNEKMDMVHVHGIIAPYIGIGQGEMTRSLVKNAHSKLQIELRAVVSNCISENKKVAGHLKYFDTPGLKEFIRIVAWPLKDSGSLRRLYVVSFEKILPEEFPFEFVKKGKAVSVKENLRVAALEQELSQTKEHLQSFIEEIETSNEELQSLNEEVHSANEELQAANEELETSNEELQSANEEMVVAYNELRDLHRLLEEKEALMELANLKMQAIMDNATQGYLLVDEKYTIVSLNHAANTIIPFFAKTALQPGDSFYNVVPANSFAVFKENFDKAWNGESTIREINLQSELVSDATDPDIWLQIRYAPVAGPNGKVEYVLISYIDLSEKVKTKQQIEASESKFRALIERGADMKTVVSLSGQHMYASPTITKVLGYSLEEFSKLRVSELLHPEGLPLFRENMRRVLDNQVKTFSSQQRLKHKNGNWIWCEGNVTNMLEEPGIKGLVANFRNINERKELEELLKKANTLARIGGWELNVEQGTLYWSDITKEIHEVGYDYTPDLEKAIHFYTEGPSRNLIIKRVKQAMEKGRLWDEELSLITAKNNECWVRCIGEAEFVNGKCIRIYGSFQDITGRKKAEESIKKSEATHRQLFNLSPAPMWVYDAETNKFTQVNKACTEQYGYSEEEFLGMTVLDISLQEEAGKKTTRKKKQFKTVFMGAGRHLKKNGEKIDVETSSIPIFLNDKNQVLVIAIDVTEKNLYEQKLAQASIKAQEDERYEIGAELHDNICQILATCQISLGMMKKSLPEEAIKFFEHTNEYIVLASDEIRNLSHHLAPAFFDDDTIQVSFERLLAGFNIEKKSLAF